MLFRRIGIVIGMLGIPMVMKSVPTKKAGVIKGITFQVDKNKVNKMPAFYKPIKSVRNKNITCPPPPPLGFSIVPTQNPNALPGAFFPNPNVSNALKPPPQKIGLTFVAGDRPKNPDFFGTPPDTCLAVGKSQVVLGDNDGVVAFDKKGKRQDAVDAEAASLLNLDGNYSIYLSNVDARIRFDPTSKRFFYICTNAEQNGNGKNTGFSLAISDSSELTDDTKWNVLNIFDVNAIPDINGCPGDQNTFDDFPSIGIDENAVYVSYNLFDSTGNFYLTSSLFVIQKKSLLDEGPVVVTAFRDFIGFPGDTFPFRGASTTIQPAMNFDKNPQFGYLIFTNPTMFGSLGFSRVINPGSTAPSLSAIQFINVPKTGSTQANPQVFPNFPQNVYGNFGLVEYVDDRLQMAHVRDGKLYTTHAIVTRANGVGDPNGDRVASRWYEIKVGCSKKNSEKATSKPTLLQVGTLFDPSLANPLHYNFPAIMTNKAGDLTVCGTVSGNKQSLSAFFTGRVTGDPLGTLRIGNKQPSVYAVGNGTFTRSLDSVAPFGAQRWGDLTYTDVDPEDEKTMWTLQEIAVNGNEVQVVARLDAP